MGLPKKALRKSSLKVLTVGSAVNDGSHQISRVTFIENNVEKHAFFKELEPKNHYPELLAKISVATSLFKRIFQGKNSAEERLVFDDDDKLVGTLSITVDGFKSFNYADEPVPIEASQKEQVIPSTKTLIEKNIMATLFGRWYLDDDDGHPHNLGFAGDEAADIDFDMFWYWFTIYMKEPRPVIGVPKKRIDLTVRDYESFPIVKDSKPYHWSTFQHPGQETLPSVMPSQILKGVLPKIYADPKQFEQLAHEPAAQEQKCAAAMKALLTYQPEMVRKRLTELFGDMTLNYTSLDDTDVSLRIKYEKEFPTLCNDQTNIKPFVDFMMDMYQKHYDNLYRVVVFYMGCENNGYGVPLASTCSTLYHKPSVYRGIEKWIKTQNESLYAKDDVSLKYDLKELQNRYHQVWRDAYAPSVKELLHSSFNLTNKLLNQVSSSSEPILIEVTGKKATDDSLTSAWELFGTMPELSVEKIEPLINVDKESKLREGLLLLVNFTREFHDTVKKYYGKERKDLTEEDNLEFTDQLNDLHKRYNLEIRKSLAHTSTFASEFNLISTKLKQVSEHVNFQLHLTTTDEQMSDTVKTTVVKELLPHTHEEVIRQFNDSLFLWAKSIKPEELAEYINEIIDNKYKPTIEYLSSRHRTQSVKKFLAESMGQSGDNRLAYILSSGKDTGALNTYLIQYLTPHMLQNYPLLSIRNAVKEGSFNTDIGIFTKAAVNFAKLDNRFTHLYNDEGMTLFYQTLFDWVDALPSQEFDKLIQNSLTEYEAGLSKVSSMLFWSSGSRRKEVEGYCKTSGHAKAVALTFLNGQDSSTLNSTLFDKIITSMKAKINESVVMQSLPGCKLIMQFDPEEHKTFYFAKLKEHSVAPSHKQNTSSSFSTTV